VTFENKKSEYGGVYSNFMVRVFTFAVDPVKLDKRNY
jgi:hypothetical protein